MSNYNEIRPGESAIHRVLRAQYAIEPKQLKALAGEVDFNYYVEDGPGCQYLLKISRPEANPESIRFEQSMAHHLEKAGLPCEVPIGVVDREGRNFFAHSFGGRPRWVRLQRWIEGRPLDEVNPRTMELLADWGAVTGAVSKALADFTNPEAPTDYHWNPSQTLESRPLARHFRNAEERALADYFWELFETEARPRLPALRKSINHNDLHEQNLLVGADGRISGLLDFGDAIYTETVNEIAIATAYAIMPYPDPLGAMAVLVGAYHRVFPLTEAEVAALYALVTARLLITVSRAALNRHREPENAYLQVSDAAAWTLLRRLRPLSPRLVHYTLRHACGWSAVPGPDFGEWAAKNRDRFRPILPLAGEKLVDLDFKVASLDLGSHADYGSRLSFAATVQRMITDGDGTVGIGGYGEVRPFYTTDAYRTEGNDGPRWRTTHLGFDLWMPAGTPVSAPLDATVHSFSYDEADRSYGACILLTHHPADFPSFHTLYGHLSKASLEGLAVGQAVAAGEAFATLGDYAENGGWPSHLHFQVLRDDLGWRGDFPGVAYPEEAEVWLGICPDGRGLVVGLGELPATPGRPPATVRRQENGAAGRLPCELENPGAESSDEPSREFGKRLDSSRRLSEDLRTLRGRRDRSLGYSLSVSYREPLHIVRGQGAYLLDVTGRRYLDTVNNVAHVGHEHPAVVRAGQRQMAVLNTNTRYLHEGVIAFAEELKSLLPPTLSVVHFVNSGSEANELALRMVEAATGSRRMIALEAGYHGNTGRIIDLSHYKFAGKGGKGRSETAEILPLPDVYRGRHRDPGTAGARYAAYVDEAIARIESRGERVGGFLAESVLSCGGQVYLPDGYLADIYRKVRAAGGVCIADEVQVGLGRVGTRWWGFELQDVVPDIVTIGKPIGNGHPLGAVVCTEEVARAFANGMEYFNTFGGNPVSSAIGRAVLRTLQTEGLRERAREVGQYLVRGLRELQNDFPLIGDVRGRGLFLGFELVEDRELKNPAREKAAYLKNRMRRLGFLMSTDGPDENVLKIKPPMVFTRANADDLLGYLRRVLGEDGMR